MKNGIILILLVLLALTVSGHDRRPIAAIEDTTVKRVAYVLQAPAQAEPMPPMRLFTVCPLGRPNVPILDERKS